MYRSHTRLRRTAAAIAAVAVIPLTASPALAGEVRLDDPRGDVWRVQEGGGDPTPMPGATVGDFVRTTFRHTDTRVQVTAKFVELKPVGKRFTLWVEMRDPDGRTPFAGVQATRANRNGKAMLITRPGRDNDCKVWHRIDYAKNTVRLGFARRCVGNPRYLQFRALSEHVRRTWTYAYLDDALSPKPRPGRAWSERVRHG